LAEASYKLRGEEGKNDYAENYSTC